MSDLGDVADELYAAPPAAFVAARKDAVALARSTGDKALATSVAALRKPTVSAWLINRLARTRPDVVDDAIGLGAQLRDATISGDRDALRGLTSRRAQLVSELVRHARGIADEHGQAFTAETQRELESTFTAAAVDEHAAAAVRSGRLTNPLTFEGFGFDQGALPPPRDPATSAPTPRKAASARPPAAKPDPEAKAAPRARAAPRTNAATPARPTAAEEAAARARAEQEAARARAVDEAEQALAVARLQQADADAELADAQRLLEEAVRTETDAEAAYQQAQADLADARADVRDAKKDVTAANRSVVAALARLEKVTRPKR